MGIRIAGGGGFVKSAFRIKIEVPLPYKEKIPAMPVLSLPISVSFFRTRQGSFIQLLRLETRIRQMILP